MLTQEQKKRIEEYAEANREEIRRLTETLTAIPAPSFHEEQKAAFVKKWLEDAGARGVETDAAGNVVFPWKCSVGGSDRDVAVFMAHMDVVFPDMQPFTIAEQDGRLCAPGILDNNVNLANLMLCARYVLQHDLDFPVGLLFVADTCEEGLGNLKGSRQIYEDYGPRIREFIGIDAQTRHIVNRAVGSQRYRVSVRTEGGHSYTAFGHANAIHELSRILVALYEVKLPTKAKTTYNVGVIEGGTSVNTIAQSASMLYEFRSEDVECLAYMENFFEKVIEDYRAEGLDIRVETLGIRPCASGMDEEAQEELTARHAEIIRMYTGKDASVKTGSTDANIPMAHGIPSVVIGTADGSGTHTREEWLDAGSLETGMKIALASVLSLAE